ncbi:MAG: hydroxymethylglutaryl-CoA lyase [Bacteroidetes bacterium]|nr:hydroxymethylglutaryl-CoA lyase [Bacteroidota bacterium]
MVKLIECPRDAMQGIKTFIPTNKKADYINALLQVGFDTIDFGSFVSPKAIPQMRDTADVLSLLHLDNTNSRLLAIVANKRGATDALQFDEITYLGYPFSVSETFQLRNTNSTIEQSLERIGNIQELCFEKGKELVVYISMGFGNPYGDPWNVEIVQRWISRLVEIGVGIFQLSDTIGVASPESIGYLFGNLIPENPEVEFGSHFHTKAKSWKEKVDAAYQNGCKRFDGAIKGYGGCPMAKDDLTGNMPTENLVHFFNEAEEQTNVDYDKFLEAYGLASDVFLHI